MNGKPYLILYGFYTVGLSHGLGDFGAKTLYFAPQFTYDLSVLGYMVGDVLHIASHLQ